MKKLIALIIIAMTLGACSKSAGDNYIGNWKMDGKGTLLRMGFNSDDSINSMGTLPIISITKSGDLYMVKDINNPTMLKVAQMCPTGASLKDNKLVCNAQFEIVFDQKHR